MIHRIDGPTTLYRGWGGDEDNKIFDLNKRFAFTTVFQSAYSFKESYRLGYRAVSPVVIHNSINHTIFHRNGRVPFNNNRKVRLISSSWSDNPRKGGPFLKWLDGHLDWDRFEYTFVGRVKEKFENIVHIQPLDSYKLADLLRKNDIFISPSHNEPCSNALLEAQACGLPAVYRNEGGNPELVSFGGLPFTGEGDFCRQLDRIVKNYSLFESLISIRSIDEVASRYIGLAREILRRI